MLIRRARNSARITAAASNKHHGPRSTSHALKGNTARHPISRAPRSSGQPPDCGPAAPRRSMRSDPTPSRAVCFRCAGSLVRCETLQRRSRSPDADHQRLQCSSSHGVVRCVKSLPNSLSWLSSLLASGPMSSISSSPLPAWASWDGRRLSRPAVSAFLLAAPHSPSHKTRPRLRRGQTIGEKP